MIDKATAKRLLGRREVVTGLGLWGATLLLQGCVTGEELKQMVTNPGGLRTANGGSARKFTAADEIQMGQTLYAPTIEQAGGAYRNQRAQQAMKDFCAPLFARSPRTDLPWEVTVLEDNTVNAWALPGGKIGINKGLLRYTANEAELAAVVAHEMTHVEKSHAVREIEEGEKTKAWTDIGKSFGATLVEGRTGVAGSVMSQTGLTDKVLTELQAPLVGLITSGYSRGNENEADAGIVAAFQREGYEARYTYSFFETLLAIIPPGTVATNSLYSKHPDTRARIDRLRSASSGLRGATVQTAHTEPFGRLKRTFPTRKPQPPVVG